MDAPITKEYWQYYFPNTEMPEGSTYESLNAAIEFMESEDTIEEALKNIKIFTDLRDKFYGNRYKAAYETRHLNAEHEKEYQTVIFAIKQYNEIIEIYKERLNG
jgi:hypothetical protein